MMMMLLKLNEGLTDKVLGHLFGLSVSFANKVITKFRDYWYARDPYLRRMRNLYDPV